MPDAARSSDPVSHGGTITTGSPNVLTGNLPTARLSDLVECAVHGVVAVTSTSQSVIVNGRGFARKDDGCLCDGAAGPGQEGLIALLMMLHEGAMSLAELLGLPDWLGLDGLAPELTDANEDGVLDTFKIEDSIEVFESEGEHGSLTVEALAVEVEAANVRGDYAIDGPIPLNQTISARARASAVDVEGEVHVNDEVTLRGRGSGPSAEAGFEFFAGDDGDRIGFDGQAGAKASVASGGGTVDVDSTAGGFLDTLAVAPGFAPLALGARALGDNPTVRSILDTPVRLEVSGGGSAKSIGADGEAFGYYQRSTEEFHLGIGGEIAALIGLDVDLHLTIGGNRDEGEAEDETGDAGPNLIVSGLSTVVVGD